MSSYSRQPNPVWLFTDLNGNILDDTYYMSFLANTIPYLPQDVYMDSNGPLGAGPWANPLQFHPDGTMPDNLYFQDGMVYRLEIRQGPLSSDPLIRLIENFDAEGSSSPSDDALATDNQITNPQFAFINFTSPLVINNTGTNTYEIAPGWFIDLVSTGAAIMTITRTAIAGGSNLPTDSPTNPSYVLSFENTSGTFTSAQLRQRFNHAPALWASTGISICLTGKMLNNSSDLNVDYLAAGGTAIPIIRDTLSSVYQFFTGGTSLPASTSTNTGDNGYVDIIVALPIFGTAFFTNIQVIGGAQTAPYEQTTVERQADQTFNYYKEKLIYKPIPSYLVGWDFATNPCQPLGSSVTATAIGADNRAKYVWDQTILFTEIDNKLAISRNTNTGGIGIINSSGTPSKFALIQYLDSFELFDILTQRLCSQLKGAITAGTGTIKGTLTLAWTAAATPFVPALPLSVVTGIPGADAVPTLDGTFTAITNVNFNTVNMPFTLTTVDTVINFSGFALPDYTAASTSTAFAIILAFDSLPDSTTVTIDYCSLNGGDIPTRPAPKSINEVLMQCQYYYEKSYDTGVIPGTATSVSQVIFIQAAEVSGGTTVMWPNAFSINYKQMKRISPTPTLYSTDGTINTVAAFARANSYNNNSAPANYASSNYGTSAGLNNMGFNPLNNSPSGPATGSSAPPHIGFIAFQYTLDSRLGVI